jgi:hypothetical protein
MTHLFEDLLTLGYVGAQLLPLDAALGHRDRGALGHPHELAGLLHLGDALALAGRGAVLPKKRTRVSEQKGCLHDRLFIFERHIQCRI